MSYADNDADADAGFGGGGDPGVDAAESEAGGMAGERGNGTETGGDGSESGGWGGYSDISVSLPGRQVDLGQAQTAAKELGLSELAAGAGQTGKGLLDMLGVASSLPAAGVLNAPGMISAAQQNIGGIQAGYGRMQGAMDVLESAGYSFGGIESTGGLDPATGQETQGGEGTAVFIHPGTGDVKRIPVTADEAAQVQAIKQNQGGLSQMFLDRYRGTYEPLQDEIIQQAQSEEVPGLARMLANVDKYYSDVAANQRRTMGGQYQYGGGLPQMGQLTTELNRARAKAGTEAQATQAYNQQRLQNMLAAAGMGQGLPGLAAQTAQAKAQRELQERSLGLQEQALSTDAERYSDQAKQALWGNIASGVGNLAQMFTASQPTATPAPAQPVYTPPPVSQTAPTPAQVSIPSQPAQPVIGEYGTTAWGM